MAFTLEIWEKVVPLHSQNRNKGSLAQLNRAFDYGSKGYRFESYRSHFFAEIAQLVEHNLAKVGVAGSSPVCRSSFYYPIL